MTRLQDRPADYQALGAAVGLSSFWAFLADVQLRLKQPDAALQSLQMGQESAAARDEQLYLSELYRLRGDARLQQGHIQPAEDAWREALDIAQQQDCKPFILRAAMRLCAHLGQRGERESARTVLAEACEGFHDGFLLLELQVAKKALDELGPPNGETSEVIFWLECAGTRPHT